MSTPLASAPSAGTTDGAVAVRERILAARSDGTPLRVRGRGHWMDAGRPVHAEALLALDGLTGIVDYIPGDLTLTALANTSLAEIERVTAAEHQWLALDPFGPSDGSLGATVATASAGPLAHAFGPPRDVVLGLEVITGAGAPIRTGGRVVKNVAGFDLTRLFTGSWGTLGVITEITVRLRALPEADVTTAIRVDATPDAVATIARAIRHAPLAPMALEVMDDRLARALGMDECATLVVRLAGNAENVTAQQSWLGRLGELIPVPSDIWGALRRCEPLGAAVVRLSAPPADVGETWGSALAATREVPGALVHASLGRGIVRCVVPSSGETLPTDWLDRVLASSDTRIFERLPGVAWGRVPSAAADRLSRGVKEAYDPADILNPGILG